MCTSTKVWYHLPTRLVGRRFESASLAYAAFMSSINDDGGALTRSTPIRLASAGFTA
ncbi:hypothetical protein PI125_g24570 [Phytophthora idaei]|nr:hypothetical protein PI125_g24570 [Phytophthora idaei]